MLNYKFTNVKQKLDDIICQMSQTPWLFCRTPGKDFSRTSKLVLQHLISLLLSMEGKSISNELLNYYNCSKDTPSASAFVQCRHKLLPEAMAFLFHEFTGSCAPDKTYKGFRLLAVDGSDVQIPTNLEHTESLMVTSDTSAPYNLLHLDAIYDLCSHLYLDVVVDGIRTCSEQRALNSMVDRSEIEKAIIMADRGYESYNVLAHVQEKGWKFLIRIKDGIGGIVSGVDLPETEEFDEFFDMHLAFKQTNEMKKLYKDRNHYKKLKAAHEFDYLPKKNRKSCPVEPYHLPFRIVRVKINDDLTETLITNLEPVLFPPEELKRLYAMRWGIETSFRTLKYTIGLLHFHSKKVEFIRQEIYARLIMYNFSELTISHIIIQRKERKYAYKANFSTAVHICREYILGNVSPPDVEAMIARSISPIRPSRNNPRKQSKTGYISFTYRLA